MSIGKRICKGSEEGFHIFLLGFSKYFPSTEINFLSYWTSLSKNKLIASTAKCAHLAIISTLDI